MVAQQYFEPNFSGEPAGFGSSDRLSPPHADTGSSLSITVNVRVTIMREHDAKTAVYPAN